MANKVTLEQKKKAVEIALGGGNPIPFLKQCGSKSADQMWYAIKRNLEKVEPETYVRLTALARKEDEPGEKIVTCCAKSTRTGVEVPDVLPDEVAEPPQPVVDLKISAEDLKDVPVVTQNIRRLEIPGMKPMVSGFDVMALRNTKSGFRYENDEKAGVITWRNDHGDEVCMTPGEWRDLVDDMGHVLQIFGF